MITIIFRDRIFFGGGESADQWLTVSKRGNLFSFIYFPQETLIKNEGRERPWAKEKGEEEVEA